MFIGIKTPLKPIFSLNLGRILFTAFALLAGSVASGSVFLNDLYFWGQSIHYINPYLWLIAFLLAFSFGTWGLTIIIFLLPLSAGLGTQLNAFLGTQFLILPNAGLDLAAGLFLGSVLRAILRAPQLLGGRKPQDFMALTKELVPWPITLVVVMITISTAIAISRNVYQSAAATSFKGMLFNLVHFRPIDWHDDYMPISDWIAYALGVSVIIVVIAYLRDQKNKNQIIFRPLIAGLIAAALLGVAQGLTGIGLPDNLLSFRKDFLGYAVIGFQPDLHAYAGHMLLGAIGLWGYFYSDLSKLERKFILFAVTLSWVGLILSKSRALLLIAVAVALIWLVWYLWKNKRHLLLPTVASLVGVISIFIVLIFNYSNHLSGIPVLSWLGELANEFKGRDLTNWSMFSGIFGSRFEIWEAAIRMWWEFPLMGIGQGNFYRLSDIASFSKSHFLILNRGENAHNYFLQTLTETGLIGVTVFGLVLIAPYLEIKDRKILRPAFIAMMGLFLGNVFSHSFLVRENLIIFTIICALIWANTTCAKNSNTKIVAGNFKNIFLYRNFSLVLLALTFSLLEIKSSFGKFPFHYGVNCWRNSPVSDDGWISGFYETDITNLVSKDQIILYSDLRRSIGNQQEVVISILKNGEVKYRTTLYLKGSGEGEPLVVQLPVDQLSEGGDSNLALQVKAENCFTPRNLGINLDGRLLGLRVAGIKSGS